MAVLTGATTLNPYMTSTACPQKKVKILPPFFSPFSPFSPFSLLADSPGFNSHTADTRNNSNVFNGAKFGRTAGFLKVAFLFLPLLYLFLFTPKLIASEASSPLSSNPSNKSSSKHYRKHYIVKRWSIIEGLPQNSVLCMLQARDGYIWLGTRSGLVRFDGVRFSTFNHMNTPTLGSDVILALYEDEENTLWIGTGGGLCRMKNGLWERFTTDDGLADQRVAVLAGTGQHGEILIGTANGLNRFYNNRFHVYRSDGAGWDNSVTAICALPGGETWVGTDGSGLFILKNNRYRPLIPTSNPPSPNASAPEPREITALCRSGKKRLWVGTENGLYYLENRRLRPAAPAHPLNEYAVRALMEDGNGAIWIGTDGEGVYRLSPKGGVVHRVATPEDLSVDFINCFLQDQEGNTWIGAYTSGLNRLTPSRVTTIPFPGGVRGNRVKTLIQDHEGILWGGTERRGLVRLIGDHLSFPFTGPAEGGGKSSFSAGKLRLRALYQDEQKGLWMGTENKGLIYSLNGKYRVFTTKQGLSADNVTVICGGSQGKGPWLGTANGLNLWLGNGFRVYGKSSKKTAPGSFIRALVMDKQGGLWIGTQKGLKYLRHSPGGTLSPQRPGEGQWQNILPPGAEPFDADILALYMDKNQTLWIGSNGSGLVRLTIKNGKPDQWSTFTTDNGLPANYIFSILEDDGNNLWMSSYKGVFRVAKEDFQKVLRDRKTKLSPLVFNEKDGMLSSECVAGGQPAALRAKDGKLYVPTLRGIAVFNPAALPLNPNPPPIAIEAILADNKTVPMDREARLPLETRMLSFRFTALSFTAPGRVRLRYKLEGAEGPYSDWREVEPLQKREALFVNLEPGNYRFRAIACNNDGLWNNNGAVFSFRIIAPFYRQTFFYVLISLFILLLAAALPAFLYHRRAHAREQDKKEGEKAAIKDKQKIGQSAGQRVDASVGASVDESVDEWGDESIGKGVGQKQKRTPLSTETPKTQSKKYMTSALTDEMADQLLPKLTALMEKEKIYLEADLTLRKLSDRMNVHYNHLSRIVNERLQKSFNDYVNGYRIREAQLKLEDPAESKKAVLQIAYETGFYSKSVFNTAFKKFTGQTPSQYRKAKQEEVRKD